jgi:uncharacterized protein
MQPLHTKVWLEENLASLPQWQRQAFTWFSNRIADHSYPCLPGRKGFLDNNMRFTFLSDPRNNDARNNLASGLKEYARRATSAGPYTSLVACFETPDDLAQTYTVTQFEELFWSILSDLNRQDTEVWPSNVGPTPDHYAWEFCFAGEPFFAFCMTPSHVARKSRYSPFFTIAFQPRFVFAHMNDGTPSGRKLKQIIRKRLAAYDDAPIHPALGWYGNKDNHEWQQYFLRDDNSALPKCPFMHRHSSPFSDSL